MTDPIEERERWKAAAMHLHEENERLREGIRRHRRKQRQARGETDVQVADQSLWALLDEQEVIPVAVSKRDGQEPSDG